MSPRERGRRRDSSRPAVVRRPRRKRTGLPPWAKWLAAFLGLTAYSMVKQLMLDVHLLPEAQAKK